MDTEKRKHERKLLQADARLADLMGRTWLPIHLLDISAGGIAFTADDEVAIDDIRNIEFSLPEYPDRIRCEIRIANKLKNYSGEDAAPGLYRIGASFEQIDTRDVWAIERFVNDN